MKFQRLGCFAYSPEEDTKAAEMPDQIDEEIKQKRADIIMEHQQQVMAEYCESLVGKEIEVLVEGFDKLAECFFGRSYADAPRLTAVYSSPVTVKSQRQEILSRCV